MVENLTSKTIKGVQWTTISTVITGILQIAYTSVMSRLLDPGAFGIIAVSQIVLNFAGYFAKMGMGQALIQKQEISSQDIRAVYTSSTLLAIVITLLIWVASPHITLVFTEVDRSVVDIVRFMSISFLIAGLTITSNSLLTRKLKFKLLAYQEIFSYSISYLGVGVVMGYMGFGVWSLVFAHLSQVVLTAVLQYLATRHSVVPLFTWKYHKPFFSYGSKISIVSIVEFIGLNLSTILVGRFFGEYKLGLYRQAYMIVDLPLYKFTLSIQKVIFPIFSIVQSDRSKLKAAYLSSVTLMASILFPICLSMSVASQEIVLVFFGEKFRESYPLLRILSLGICFKFMTVFAGIVCDATAKLNGKFVVQLTYVFFLAVASYFFKNYGLIGFAVIITIGEIIRNFAYNFIAGKLLRATFGDFLKAYQSGLLSGLIIAGLLYAGTVVMDYFGFSMLLKLSIQVVLGFITLSCFIFLRPPLILQKLIKEYVLTLPVFEGKLKFVLTYLSWNK